MKGADLETVNPQALEGVPDAMSVSNLTEASLLHTVRERYNRDEVSCYQLFYHGMYLYDSKTLGNRPFRARGGLVWP